LIEIERTIMTSGHLRPHVLLALPLAIAFAATGVDSAQAQGPFQLQLETAKPRYLVGEPVVVVVTQRGTATIHDEGWVGLGAATSPLRILVDRGAGFARFQRRVLYPLGERTSVRTVVPDLRRQEFVLSFDDAIGDVVFPAAGSARIVVEYRDETLGTVRSNVAVVDVAAPDGAESLAYQRLRALPERGQQFYLDLTAADDAPQLSDAASQQLIAAAGGSVYVQGARVRSLAFRVGHPSDRFDPGNLANPAPIDRGERRRLARQRRAALVNEAEALLADLTGGQFEPDALAVLAATYEANDQDALARQTWQRIVDGFPRRAASDEARQALEPDEPGN
jgi:hypothetical protein